MSRFESSSRLRAASIGLVLAVATILFGQGMGIVFGRLKASATEVRETGAFVLATVAVLVLLIGAMIGWQRAARAET